MSAELWRELARLAERFAAEADAAATESSSSRRPTLVMDREALTWRERLWSVPADTRLNVRELAEALGQSVSWVYKHTSPRSGQVLLPHRQLTNGKLAFLAGEIRSWLTETEAVAGDAPLGRRRRIG